MGSMGSISFEEDDDEHVDEEPTQDNISCSFDRKSSFRSRSLSSVDMELESWERSDHKFISYIIGPRDP
jgi:hypothetical protein